MIKKSILSEFYSPKATVHQMEPENGLKCKKMMFLSKNGAVEMGNSPKNRPFLAH
jgi:hypothetical protein